MIKEIGQKRNPCPGLKTLCLRKNFLNARRRAKITFTPKNKVIRKKLILIGSTFIF